ncbi:benzoate/H(+) symporter BenE family transporter [Marisediminicola sp. LYQ134]|uniref:benzoate/H(+) symporter BenE family transporter n=1 Tax=unclassified Marisediminicola TaxID=2618316 RepID=UPI00398397CE
MVQPVLAGIVGSLTGFASSFAIVIAGLTAVGATAEQAASGLLILCVAQGLLSIVFSLCYRIPLAFAWSTPGAALLVTAQSITGDFRAAVGAFIVCGVLVVVVGAVPVLGKALTRIPQPLASGMLAGILFPLCLAPVVAAVALPALALPTIAAWLVVSRFAPRWAVPAALVVTAVTVALTAQTDGATATLVSPSLAIVAPVFDLAVIASLGIPLFIVTMAGQNVPGFAVLTTFGYRAPAPSVLMATGVVTSVGAFFGGHAVNLAAITAAIMAGPDSHPDASRRWVSAVAGGVSSLALALTAGYATALVSASPPALINAVAGLALLGAFTAAIVSALDVPEHRLAALVTFLVVTSGVVIGGVGSALWGLLAGAVVMLWLRKRPGGMSDRGSWLRRR